MDTPDLRYPIGKFRFPETVSADERATFVTQIAEAPANLREAVKGLDDAQLDTPYRPGGWTVRQLVHHVPDSHLNSYMRFCWALTEEEPTIKPYFEDRWAELSNARTTPVEISLRLLESLHGRWLGLLRSLTEEQWRRTFRHPDLGVIALEMNAALYAWHGRHHVAHVTTLRQRMSW
jgi:DinB superfamily